MDVVIAGQGALALALLEGVQRSPHRAVALWLDPSAARAGEPRRRAERLGVPVGWLPAPPPPCDVLLVGDLGQVLDDAVLEVPRVAGVNAHWSLLPRHRGPAPGAAAILAGDARSGLTWHTLTSEVDRGLCLAQHAFDLRPDETRTSLYLRAAALAQAHVASVLAQLDDCGPQGEPLGEGTWQPALRPADTRLEWTRPAAELHRLVRAATRPAAWFVVGGRGVRVSQAGLVAGDVDAAPGTIVPGPGVCVATSRGALRIERAWVPRLSIRWPWPGLWRPSAGVRLE